MDAIKFFQTWDPVVGRKQEYATFIIHEFEPLMKALGLEAVSGWYTLAGGWPRVLFENVAESLDRTEKLLNDKRFSEMLKRFMSLVSNYASGVLQPAGWMSTQHREGASSMEGIKYVQAWDVVPTQMEAYEQWLEEIHVPHMEAIGLAVTGGWHLMIGSGRQVVSEALAPDLASVAKALNDERYLQMVVRMEEVVTHYESHIMIPLFLRENGSATAALSPTRIFFTKSTSLLRC
ncbi:MAG: hypothetical protein JW836_17615 [Deltaproteobacteria bacterium]|nr:hypothetical protein [Deltaproteobacteria bacterium]